MQDAVWFCWHETYLFMFMSINTRNTLTQASKNDHKPFLFCKRVLCNKHNLTPSIISNRQTLIVRRENAFCKFHTFFRFVYHVSCLPCFKTKNKIRFIDAPKFAFTHRNLPESEKYIWITQNVHEKSRIFILASRNNWVSCNQTLGCLSLYGNSRVSRAQPRILLQHDWLLFVFWVFLHHVLK